MTLEEKYAKVVELLKNCRKHGLQSKYYSFWDCKVNTDAVDEFLKEVEVEE